jgi:hypothetical protein
MLPFQAGGNATQEEGQRNKNNNQNEARAKELKTKIATSPKGSWRRKQRLA